jgi:acetyl esterase/lipase
MDARTGIDAELLAALDLMPYEVITRENLVEVRERLASMRELMPATNFRVTMSQRKVRVDDHETTLYIYDPETVVTPNAGLLWLHGGGYIMGDAEDQLAEAIAGASGCKVISVDYRLAPEHPFPAGVEDSYGAMLWVLDNAAQLGIDSNRFAIGGASAGAGMAAGVTLMSRDRGGPLPGFQFLLYPMLDNLHATSSGKMKNHAVWDRQTSLGAWEMYLNGTPGKGASPYAAASRAKDLAGLPPTYITVGTQDLFRDENIDYAQRLMAAGVPTQLEVFPGVFHAAENFVPEAKISQHMRSSYLKALGRALSECT